MSISIPNPAPALPWTYLQEPARVSLIGNDLSGKTTLLYWLSEYDPTKPTVTTDIPIIGLILEQIHLNHLTITSQDFGHGRPAKFTKEVDVMRNNCDAVMVTVDCRDRQRWQMVPEELEGFVLTPHECKGAPLLILANWWDAEGAMSLGEIERRLLTPIPKYYRGLGGDDRPFAVMPINASTGAGAVEALRWLVKSLNTRKERPSGTLDEFYTFGPSNAAYFRSKERDPSLEDPRTRYSGRWLSSVNFSACVSRRHG